MQENHTKNVEASTCRASEKFYLENTLLRVSGALFCHDAKRAGMRIQTIEINRGDEEKRIVIEPHPNRLNRRLIQRNNPNVLARQTLPVVQHRVLI